MKNFYNYNKDVSIVLFNYSEYSVIISFKFRKTELTDFYINKTVGKMIKDADKKNTKLFLEKQVPASAFASLKNKGFIFSRESVYREPQNYEELKNKPHDVESLKLSNQGEYITLPKNSNKTTHMANLNIYGDRLSIKEL